MGFAGPESRLLSDKSPYLGRRRNSDVGVRREVNDAQVVTFMSAAGSRAVLFEIDNAAANDIRVTHDLINLEFPDEAELAPINPRNDAPIWVTSGPEEGLVHEHPVHAIGVRARLFGREKKNTRGRVSIEQRRRGRSVISGRSGVSPQAYSRLCPDRRQFIFALDCNSTHIGDVVKIENRTAGDLSNSEQVVGVQKNRILFVEPL